MARARLTPNAHSNGSITLAESTAYAELSDRDRYVEYDAIAQRMQLVAVDAKANQDLVNRIGMLRDNLSSAKHNGYANLPTHDEFVTVLDQYNAWALSKSPHLKPTSAAPATVVADTPAVSPAPSTTVHETTTIDDTATTTPPPATTTTTVVNDAEPAWLNGYDTRAVQPLRDAVFGVNDKPGLDKRVTDLETDVEHLMKVQPKDKNGKYVVLAGQSPDYKIGGIAGLAVALVLFVWLMTVNHTEILQAMFVGIVAGVGIGALVAWLTAKKWHHETTTSDNN